MRLPRLIAPVLCVVSGCSFSPVDLDALVDSSVVSPTACSECGNEELCVDTEDGPRCSCGSTISSEGAAACVAPAQCVSERCNQAPEIDLEESLIALAETTFRVEPVVFDADDDELEFSWTVSPPCTPLDATELNTSVIQINTPGLDESCTIEVRVSDGIEEARARTTLSTVDRGTYVRAPPSECVSDVDVSGAGRPESPWCSIEPAILVAIDTQQRTVFLHEEPIELDGLFVPPGVTVEGGYQTDTSPSMAWIQTSRTPVLLDPADDPITLAGGGLEAMDIELSAACDSDCSMVEIFGGDSAVTRVLLDASRNNQPGVSFTGVDFVGGGDGGSATLTGVGIRTPDLAANAFGVRSRAVLGKLVMDDVTVTLGGAEDARVGIRTLDVASVVLQNSEIVTAGFDAERSYGILDGASPDTPDANCSGASNPSACGGSSVEYQLRNVAIDLSSGRHALAVGADFNRTSELSWSAGVGSAISVLAQNAAFGIRTALLPRFRLDGADLFQVVATVDGASSGLRASNVAIAFADGSPATARPQAPSDEIQVEAMRFLAASSSASSSEVFGVYLRGSRDFIVADSEIGFSVESGVSVINSVAMRTESIERGEVRGNSFVSTGAGTTEQVTAGFVDGIAAANPTNNAPGSTDLVVASNDVRVALRGTGDATQACLILTGTQSADRGNNSAVRDNTIACPGSNDGQVSQIWTLSTSGLEVVGNTIMLEDPKLPAANYVGILDGFSGNARPSLPDRPPLFTDGSFSTGTRPSQNLRIVNNRLGENYDSALESRGMFISRATRPLRIEGNWVVMTDGTVVGIEVGIDVEIIHNTVIGPPSASEDATGLVLYREANGPTAIVDANVLAARDLDVFTALELTLIDSGLEAADLFSQSLQSFRFNLLSAENGSYFELEDDSTEVDEDDVLPLVSGSSISPLSPNQLGTTPLCPGDFGPGPASEALDFVTTGLRTTTEDAFGTAIAADAPYEPGAIERLDGFTACP